MMTMRRHRYYQSVLALLVIQILQHCSAVAAGNDVEIAAKNLIAWISTLDHGFFNDKQGLVDGNKLVATKPIKKGELLLQVPWDAILMDENVLQAEINCDLVHRLAHELAAAAAATTTTKNNDEETNPYIQYLALRKRHQIPSDFTDFGKEILMDLLSYTTSELPPQEPFSWLDEDWYGKDGCQGDPSDDVAKQAAMLYVQLQYNDMMVPIYDFYRHRNGPKYYNTFVVRDMNNNNNNNNNNKGMQVAALRDIEVGEELHQSINQCHDCHESYQMYGSSELFRDKGIIEEFPQRWVIDPDSIVFELHQNDNNDGKIDVHWVTPLPYFEGYLRELIKRLESSVFHLHFMRTRAFNLYQDQVQDQQEWDLIWEYNRQLANALAYAHNDIDDVEETHYMPIIAKGGEEVCMLLDSSAEAGGQCYPRMINHYDEMEDEQDDLDYISPTCDNSEWMEFVGYETLEDIQTSYQHALFNRHNETGDVCMDIDEIVQICSSYRPQYHEYSANYAARFLDSVKRVLFVGGGDSMLLHEALKYKNLEKVVGLELDQVITRKSFKYFHTQPHFDDDRVEWWFGDATKSLLLLSKDYWQSFDLVLVDLSETAMALSVTTELDVFAALALLLKPEGIMVKNELYIDEMSDVFDYTVQIKYDSPKICSQIMALGSNRADFFHKLQTDHGVHNYLLDPVDEIEDRFEYMHDYRKNNARADGKCDSLPQAKDVAEQGRSAGILHVLDIEDVKGEVRLDESIADAVKKAGLKHVSTQTSTSKSTLLAAVILEEGYVLARHWTDRNYVAIDVNLWGAFHAFDELQTLLLAAFNSKSLSAFRVVVGGMYGSSTWREDQAKIGPQIVQFRNCDEKATIESSDQAVVVSGLTEAAVEEFLKIAPSNSSSLTVGIVCGYEDDDDCAIKDILDKLPIASKVVTFWTCPGLKHMHVNDEEDEEEDDLSPEQLSHMFVCEKAMMAKLKELKENDKNLDAFALDGSVTREMIQIFNSIWGIAKFREWYTNPNQNLFFGMSFKSDEVEHSIHHNFLDRYRRDVRYDPAAHAKFLAQDGNIEIEFDVVTVGDNSIFQSLATAEGNIKSRLEGKNADIELVRINGAQWNYREELQPREFSQADYDEEPGKLQYSEQEPFGRETLLQFDFKDDVTMPSLDIFASQLKEALPKAGFTEIEYRVDHSVGEGGVLSYVAKEGSVIIVWDGRLHVDVNLFRFDDRVELADSFLNLFLATSGRILTLGLRDDFPRGTGRVVNFQNDITAESS
ncbi:unnamed protein product [Cylindrotheca closterium]|uniref:PABS domain-containing protein n=1 Tax=Cylindrotheca closterium TaxID=2856 RepID=A0AAD2G402_9STRA|nr:unnamed protein product [Cylindrotheca closterium]